MSADDLIQPAQRYGDELDDSRIISGFAAKALPLGSVLLRLHCPEDPAPHAVVKVHGGWWSADATSPEPLAGDLQFRVLHVPALDTVGRVSQWHDADSPRPSWRGRTFLTGARRSFADGTS